MSGRTGKCLCGGVTIEARGEPLVARACWCRLCQTIASGSPTVNAIYPRANVSIAGEVRTFEVVPDSGHPKLQHFCPACGTQIAVTSDRIPDLLILRLGVLDEPDIAPVAAIWTESAPAWACIDAGLPRFEQGAPPPKA